MDASHVKLCVTKQRAKMREKHDGPGIHSTISLT
jgi:hypothetical protein